MTEQAHTPGPWVVGSGGAINDTKRKRIAVVALGFRSSDEWDANVSLIAAAPDLLSELTALKKLRDDLVKAMEAIKEQCARGLNGGDITATRALEDIHDIAYALIAKAIGNRT